MQKRVENLAEVVVADLFHRLESLRPALFTKCGEVALDEVDGRRVVDVGRGAHDASTPLRPTGGRASSADTTQSWGEPTR